MRICRTSDLDIGNMRVRESFLPDAGDVIVFNLIDDVPPLGVLSIHDALNFLLYPVLS